jgi:transposase
MRVFLGWLRGERGHCGMVAIPTIEEEDAKRPSHERENLVGERTRIINRLKSDLTRLGIRGFKPQLRKAPQLLEWLCRPEDSPIPPNTLDEMRRDQTRLALIREQINAIEQARLARLEQAPQTRPNAMIWMFGQHPWSRHRNGRNVGAGSALPQSARPQGGRTLRRAHRCAG